MYKSQDDKWRCSGCDKEILTPFLSQSCSDCGKEFSFNVGGDHQPKQFDVLDSEALKKRNIRDSFLILLGILILGIISFAPLKKYYAPNEYWSDEVSRIESKITKLEDERSLWNWQIKDLQKELYLCRQMPIAIYGKYYNDSLKNGAAPKDAKLEAQTMMNTYCSMLPDLLKSFRENQAEATNGISSLQNELSKASEHLLKSRH